MPYLVHLFIGLEHLSDTEFYQVWIGDKCLFSARGTDLKSLIWERDSVLTVSFACIRGNI